MNLSLLPGLLIASLMLLYSFNTSLAKNNSFWVISESIKTLEIKASTVFNLDFANNNI